MATTPATRPVPGGAAGPDGPGSAAVPAPAASRPALPVLAGFVLLACLAVAAILWAGRGTAPFYDEWQWIVERRAWTPATFLRSHNGHFSAVPVLVYKLLLAGPGIEHHWAFRLVLALLHVGCAALVLVLAHRRVGAAGGLAAAALVLFLGSAGDDLLWPFQIGFLTSCLAGLAMLVALDARSRRGDALAAALLLVSLASSALGIPFLVLAAVDLVARRGRAWLRVLVPPVLLYGAWFALAGGGGTTGLSPAAAVPFAVAAAAGAAAGVAGLTASSAPVGPALLGALAAGGAWTLRRRAGVVDTGRVAAVTAAAVAYWLLLGLTRADLDAPDTPRYLYLGALLLVLLVVELAAGRRVRGRAALAVLAAAVATAALGNLDRLREIGADRRGNAVAVRSDLGAWHLVRDRVPDSFFVSFWTLEATSGPLSEAERDVGSVAATPAEIAAGPAVPRRDADRLLLRSGALTSAASGGRSVGTPPRLATPDPRARSAPGRCLQRRPGPGTTTLAIAPGSALTIRGAPNAASSRRFGDERAALPLARTGSGTTTLRAAPDVAPQPWLVDVDLARGARLCVVR